MKLEFACDRRFVDFANICIIGAATGDDFFSVFDAVETVPGLNKRKTSLNEIDVAIVFDVLLRKASENDPSIHRRVLSLLTKLHRSADDVKEKKKGRVEIA